jgi:hypothetical protein
MHTDDDLKTIFKTHKIELEALMKDNHCLGGHQCFMSNLTKLCKAELYGVENLLECKETNPIKCPRAKSYGNAYMCNCKVRVYIYHNIGM